MTQGAWTEFSLHRIGHADTSDCKTCQQTPGTRQHRYYQCPAEPLKQVRQRMGDSTWEHVAATTTGQTMLWTRGLVRDPSVDWAFHPIDDSSQWQLADNEDTIFTGSVCIDGSRLGSTKAPLAGWAAVQLPESGDQGKDMIAAKTAWGPTPLQLPVHARSIKRSEMYSFLFVLRHGLLPLTIWTDHKAIVDGLWKGRRWTTKASRAHADLWKQIWWQLEDMGVQEGSAELQQMVRHVKAHRTLKVIDTLGADDQRVAYGNRLVDIAAKSGAEMAPGFGRDQALRQLSAKIKWALKAIAWWHVQPEFQETGWPDVTPRKQWEGLLATAPLHPRRRCSRWARSAHGRARLRRGACKPQAPTDARQRGGVVVWHEHIVMVAGDSLIFCLRCGKWAHRMMRHLRTARCVGHPTPVYAGRLRHLCGGRHPLPPHAFVGDARPLQLETWPRWSRQADADRAEASVMKAAAVAPLVGVEEGLAALEEISSDEELEVAAELELVVLD